MLQARSISPSNQKPRSRQSPIGGEGPSAVGPDWKNLHSHLVPVGLLNKLAIKFNLPYDAMKQAHDLFVDSCERAAPLLNDGSCFNPVEDGRLTWDSFAKILCKLTSVSHPDDLPEGLLHNSYDSANQSQSDSLDFSDFAQWYSQYGFSETVLLTKEQREIRQIARKHGLPIVEVERYKASFDAFDEDGSGEMEFGEFQKLLCTLMKIPAHLDLPNSRVRQFWTETDIDGSGAVGFEEFLMFYIKYFEVSADAKNPCEEFYRGIRPVPVQRSW